MAASVPPKEQLEAILHLMGIPQYLDRFEAEGFDSWEALVQITENDLEVCDADSNKSMNRG